MMPVHVGGRLADTLAAKLHSHHPGHFHPNPLLERDTLKRTLLVGTPFKQRARLKKGRPFSHVVSHRSANSQLGAAAREPLQGRREEPKSRSTCPRFHTVPGKRPRAPLRSRSQSCATSPARRWAIVPSSVARSTAAPSSTPALRRKASVAQLTRRASSPC